MSKVNTRVLTKSKLHALTFTSLRFLCPIASFEGVKEGATERYDGIRDRA